MARSEARISVDVWGPESDFTSLTPGAQRLYFFLLSQPDLAHDGVLALRERRWSRAAAGLTVDQIALELKELEATRYIVVDYDAEELLIRSFIRRDKVYRQPNVLRAAFDHLRLVSSFRIRCALRAELERIYELEMPKDSGPIILEMLEHLGDVPWEPLPEGPPNPSANPPGNPSADPSPGTPGERGVVTGVTTDSPFPDPLSKSSPASDEPMRMIDIPTPTATPSSHPKRAWTDAQIDADPHWRAFWAAYPSTKDKGHARKAWLTALRKGVDPEAITARALEYRNQPGRTVQFTAHAATWLNGERWDDGETAPPPETATRKPTPWEN